MFMSEQVLTTMRTYSNGFYFYAGFFDPGGP